MTTKNSTEIKPEDLKKLCNWKKTFSLIVGGGEEEIPKEIALEKYNLTGLNQIEAEVRDKGYMLLLPDNFYSKRKIILDKTKKKTDFIALRVSELGFQEKTSYEKIVARALSQGFWYPEEEDVYNFCATKEHNDYELIDNQDQEVTFCTRLLPFKKSFALLKIEHEKFELGLHKLKQSRFIKTVTGNQKTINFWPNEIVIFRFRNPR